jgi:hypothetical protein
MAGEHYQEESFVKLVNKQNVFMGWTFTALGTVHNLHLWKISVKQTIFLV